MHVAELRRIHTAQIRHRKHFSKTKRKRGKHNGAYKRSPEIAAEYVRAEMKIQHTWKKSKSLQSVFNECMDIDDIDEDIKLENRQLSLFDK